MSQDKMIIDAEGDYTELERFRQQTNRIIVDLTNISNKRKTVPKPTRVIAWNNTFGISIGQAPCFCCRLILITQSNFEAGHVISNKNGGSVLAENIRPICSTCNKAMGTKCMYNFIKDNHYW